MRESGGDGVHRFFKIMHRGQAVGRYGLSFYDDIKAVGIGSLEVFKPYRGNGYGTKAIRRIIEKYKDSYDLIYCFVDAGNAGAIRLYDRIGRVFAEDGANGSNQYYVELYNAGRG